MCIGGGSRGALGGAIVYRRRACAGGQFPLSHILPLKHLFVLKMLSHTQRATEIKQFVGGSLKPLRCRDQALRAIRTVLRKWRMRIVNKR